MVISNVLLVMRGNLRDGSSGVLGFFVGFDPAEIQISTAISTVVWGGIVTWHDVTSRSEATFGDITARG